MINVEFLYFSVVVKIPDHFVNKNHTSVKHAKKYEIRLLVYQILLFSINSRTNNARKDSLLTFTVAPVLTILIKKAGRRQNTLQTK